MISVEHELCEIHERLCDLFKRSAANYYGTRLHCDACGKAFDLADPESEMLRVGVVNRMAIARIAFNLSEAVQQAMAGDREYTSFPEWFRAKTLCDALCSTARALE